MPKKKGLATQKAYEQIKRMISMNQLVSGQKLIYGDIAKKLNLGITPVIQALNRLESSNLVRYEANKGYFVGEITENEARQLYQAREALEIYVIPYVVKNIKEEKLKEIKERLSLSKKSNTIRSRRELILGDIQFHLEIVRCSENDIIYNLLKGILEQIYLKYRPEHLTDERIGVILSEHRQILASLLKGEVDETKMLLQNHIRSGMEYVISTIRLERPAFFETENEH